MTALTQLTGSSIVRMTFQNCPNWVKRGKTLYSSVTGSRYCVNLCKRLTVKCLQHALQQGTTGQHFTVSTTGIRGSPGGSDDKESAGDTGDSGSTLRREDPQRREWLPTAVFLPGEFHGQRSLASYSPWGRKQLATTKQLTHRHLWD